MKVVVRYHHEAEGVWADSSDLPGLAVVGGDLAEARQLVREGVEFYLDGQVDLREEFETRAPVVDFHVIGKPDFIQFSGGQPTGYYVAADAQIHAVKPAGGAPVGGGQKSSTVGTLVDV